jgi:UDP-N-acetylmuramate--alanine ligase
MNIKGLSDYRGKRIHFIGIGGCSMSGLAMVLKNIGFEVSGSDLRESAFTERLKKEGIPFTIGHDAKNIEGAGLIVYNAAIKQANPEFAAAVERQIPIMQRSELLGKLSAEFGTVACVSGCHGKTTITSMIALILITADVDATVHVGGMVDFLQGGVRLGQSDIFVTEACEYVESFLTLNPTHIIVNNIDDDHLDYFRDIEHIYSAFHKFVALMGQDGILFGNGDELLVQRLLAESNVNKTTYGLGEGNDFTAQHIEFDENGSPSFDFIAKGKNLGRIQLNIPGMHNVINALAALAMTTTVFHAGIEACRKALFNYHLAGRRFELFGERNGVKIIHDYAHHPSEIDACLKAAKLVPHKKLWALFQCNSYTRAKTLKDKYALAFSSADQVIVPDIFPGRDIDKGEIHAKDLVDAISRNSSCVYVPTFEQIREFLDQNAQAGDIVIALGSGDVNKQAYKLL